MGEGEGGEGWERKERDGRGEGEGREREERDGGGGGREMGVVSSPDPTQIRERVWSRIWVGSGDETRMGGEGRGEGREGRGGEGRGGEGRGGEGRGGEGREGGTEQTEMVRTYLSSSNLAFSIATLHCSHSGILAMASFSL